MQIRKSRWSRVYESAEEELVELLARKRISARRWTAEEGEEIGPNLSPADMRLWCAEGQLTCTVEGKPYSLQPGDELERASRVWRLCLLRIRALKGSAMKVIALPQNGNSAKFEVQTAKGGSFV